MIADTQNPKVRYSVNTVAMETTPGTVIADLLRDAAAKAYDDGVEELMAASGLDAINVFVDQPVRVTVEIWDRVEGEQ